MKNNKIDYSTKSQDEKIELIEKILIHYPLFEEIVKAIADCHDRVQKGRRPKCFFITGKSGAGKSTLVEYYAKQYPRRYTEAGAVIPVLLTKVFTPATVKGMVTNFLSDLGDPCATRGSKVAQTIRIVKLLKACKVELILLDEFSDLIDRRTDTVMQDAAQWLRQLVDAVDISVVVIGLPSAERILHVNSQLRRRFSARKDLKAFEWETIDNRKNFRKLLYAIELQLPFAEPSNLADSDIAFRTYCASHGLIGYIMKIICSAAVYAIRENGNRITLDLLAEAYDEEVSRVDPNKGNPYRIEMEELKKRPMESFIEDGQDQLAGQFNDELTASEVLTRKSRTK